MEATVALSSLGWLEIGPSSETKRSLGVLDTATHFSHLSQPHLASGRAYPESCALFTTQLRTSSNYPTSESLDQAAQLTTSAHALAQPGNAGTLQVAKELQITAIPLKHRPGAHDKPPQN